MTIDSAKKINDQDFKASIDAFNDTGYSNEDLCKSLNHPPFALSLSKGDVFNLLIINNVCFDKLSTNG